MRERYLGRRLCFEESKEFARAAHKEACSGRLTVAYLDQRK
jgi:hypothetical protein